MEGFKQAEVKRQDSLLTISWEGDNLGTVKIYQSADPDAAEADAVLIGESAERKFELELSRDERVYFILAAENGARIRVAERVMQMDNLVNFRDLGGYLTEDGRRTKWGKLLRSAAHDGITERDAEFLRSLGVKTVVDYRTSVESADHPDVKLDGVAYQTLCPFEESNATNTLDTNQHRQMRSAEDAIKMLTGINRQLAASPHCNKTYRGLMQIALDTEQVPVVQHCTSGKDRVGVGSATMLMALGVPRETIMADYLLSNENQLSASKLGSGTMSAGQEITPEMMKMFAALTKVHAEYLEAFFDEVDTRWGGTEGYLKNALGLTDEELEKMKDLYLEQM